MKQNISKLQNSKGFTGIEILIFIAIISAGFGGVALIFKDVIKEQFKKASVEEVKIEETKPIVNPFPARPSEKSAELPKETSVYRGETGVPIVKPEAQSANASGEWHGRYEVTAPPECAGESAGWQATLNDKNGIITGQFSTDIGVAGSVSGNSEGENASWGVGGGGSGVKFDGAIKGNTMSGKFTGLPCTKNSERARSTGTYFGGRIVR